MYAQEKRARRAADTRNRSDIGEEDYSGVLRCFKISHWDAKHTTGSNNLRRIRQSRLYKHY